MKTPGKVVLLYVWACAVVSIGCAIWLTTDRPPDPPSIFDSDPMVIGWTCESPIVSVGPGGVPTCSGPELPRQVTFPAVTLQR